jgi:predicted metalloprotease
MLWRGRRQSENIEDRRGMAGPVVGGGIGAAVLALVIYLLGGDPSVVLQNQPPPSPAGRTAPAGVNDEQKQFVAVVLADTEDVWSRLFQERGRTYREPRLVLFTRSVDSACGFASAASGPFYCPGDRKVYIDLGFNEMLASRFGAPGEFAKAYVIAHEVGHHVQNLLGTMEQVDARRQRLSREGANQLSVRLELQADFLAGVWAHHAQRMKQILVEQDIDDGLRAAGAIGDDRLQMEGQGYVVPESFTHGTSQQRVRWFRRGWDSGNLSQGDTFSATNL